MKHGGDVNTSHGQQSVQRCTAETLEEAKGFTKKAMDSAAVIPGRSSAGLSSGRRGGRGHTIRPQEKAIGGLGNGEGIGKAREGIRSICAGDGHLGPAFPGMTQPTPSAAPRSPGAMRLGSPPPEPRKGGFEPGLARAGDPEDVKIKGSKKAFSTTKNQPNVKKRPKCGDPVASQPKSGRVGKQQRLRRPGHLESVNVEPFAIPPPFPRAHPLAQHVPRGHRRVSAGAMRRSDGRPGGGAGGGGAGARGGGSACGAKGRGEDAPGGGAWLRPDPPEQRK